MGRHKGFTHSEETKRRIRNSNKKAARRRRTIMKSLEESVTDLARIATAALKEKSVHTMLTETPKEEALRLRIKRKREAPYQLPANAPIGQKLLFHFGLYEFKPDHRPLKGYDDLDPVYGKPTPTYRLLCKGMNRPAPAARNEIESMARLKFHEIDRLWLLCCPVDERASIPADITEAESHALPPHQWQPLPRPTDIPLGRYPDTEWIAQQRATFEKPEDPNA